MPTGIGIGLGIEFGKSSVSIPVPTAAPGSVFSLAVHPALCCSDALHRTPCNVGDAVQSYKELVSGTWFTQPTSGLRPILRLSGSKYYLDFNGTNNFRFPGIAALGTNISVGVAMNASVSTRGDIFTRYGTGEDGTSVFDMLFGLTSNKVSFFISDGGGKGSASGSTYSTGVDYRLVGNYPEGAGTIKTYVNGTRDIALSGNGTLVNSAATDIVVGNNSLGTAGYTGKFYGAAIYNSVQSSGSPLTAFDAWLRGLQP